MKSQSQKRKESRVFLKNRYNILKSGNRVKINLMGILILNNDLTSISDRVERRRHKRERWWLNQVTLELIKLERAVVEEDMTYWSNHTSRPHDFDVQKLFFEGGLEAYTKKVEESKEYQVKLSFTHVSRIGIATARKYWDQDIRSLPRLLSYLRDQLKTEGLSTEKRFEIEGQIESIVDPPEEMMSSSTQLEWQKMLGFKVQKGEIKVSKDLGTLGGGSCTRGRVLAPDGEVIIHKESWTQDEVDELNQGLIATGLVKKILHKESKRPFNFNRDLGDKPPLAEGIRYQKVIIRDPNGGKCYFQDQFIVETKSLPTAGLLLQGSASWSDAAVLAALDEGYVLVPSGLYPQAEWDRCQVLFNSGQTLVPTPVVLKDQQHLCRIIDIPYHPPADRHANAAKDGNAWLGISEEDWGKMNEKPKKKVGVDANGKKGKKGKAKAKGKPRIPRGGKAERKGTNPRRRRPASSKSGQKRRRSRSSSPSSSSSPSPSPSPSRSPSRKPSARKKRKVSTDKRTRDVGSDAESGGDTRKKRRVGVQTRGIRGGAKIDDDDSDLTELEESEEEITRSQGRKGKNSSKVGQNWKGVGTKDLSGGNEESGAGLRRSARGKVGEKK